MGVGVISALNESIEETVLDCLAAVLDVEVEPTLRQSVFDVSHQLLLDACLVVTDVFSHQLPQLVSLCFPILVILFLFPKWLNWVPCCLFCSILLAWETTRSSVVSAIFLGWSCIWPWLFLRSAERSLCYPFRATGPERLPVACLWRAGLIGSVIQIGTLDRDVLQILLNLRPVVRHGKLGPHVSLRLGACALVRLWHLILVRGSNLLVTRWLTIKWAARWSLRSSCQVRVRIKLHVTASL